MLQSCDVCNYITNSNDDLEKHNHCSKCGQYHKSLQELTTHIITKHSKPTTDNQTEETFVHLERKDTSDKIKIVEDNKSIEAIAKSTHDDTKVQCDVCKLKVINIETMIKHMAEQHVTKVNSNVEAVAFVH